MALKVLRLITLLALIIPNQCAANYSAHNETSEANAKVFTKRDDDVSDRNRNEDKGCNDDGVGTKTIVSSELSKKDVNKTVAKSEFVTGGDIVLDEKDFSERIEENEIDRILNISRKIEGLEITPETGNSTTFQHNEFSNNTFFNINETDSVFLDDSLSNITQKSDEITKPYLNLSNHLIQNANKENIMNSENEEKSINHSDDKETQQLNLNIISVNKSDVTKETENGLIEQKKEDTKLEPEIFHRTESDIKSTAVTTEMRLNKKDRSKTSEYEHVPLQLSSETQFHKVEENDDQYNVNFESEKPINKLKISGNFITKDNTKQDTDTAFLKDEERYGKEDLDSSKLIFVEEKVDNLNHRGTKVKMNQERGFSSNKHSDNRQYIFGNTLDKTENAQDGNGQIKSIINYKTETKQCINCSSTNMKHVQRPSENPINTNADGSSLYKSRKLSSYNIDNSSSLLVTNHSDLKNRSNYTIKNYKIENQLSLLSEKQKSLHAENIFLSPNMNESSSNNYLMPLLRNRGNVSFTNNTKNIIKNKLSFPTNKRNSSHVQDKIPLTKNGSHLSIQRKLSPVVKPNSMQVETSSLADIFTMTAATEGNSVFNIDRASPNQNVLNVGDLPLKNLSTNIVTRSSVQILMSSKNDQSNVNIPEYKQNKIKDLIFPSLSMVEQNTSANIYNTFSNRSNSINNASIILRKQESPDNAKMYNPVKFSNSTIRNATSYKTGDSKHNDEIIADKRPLNNSAIRETPRGLHENSTHKHINKSRGRLERVAINPPASRQGDYNEESVDNKTELNIDMLNTGAHLNGPFNETENSRRNQLKVVETYAMGNNSNVMNEKQNVGINNKSRLNAGLFFPNKTIDSKSGELKRTDYTLIKNNSINLNNTDTKYKHIQNETEVSNSTKLEVQIIKNEEIISKLSTENVMDLKNKTNNIILETNNNSTIKDLLKLNTNKNNNNEDNLNISTIDFEMTSKNNNEGDEMTQFTTENDDDITSLTKNNNNEKTNLENDVPINNQDNINIFYMSSEEDVSKIISKNNHENPQILDDINENKERNVAKNLEGLEAQQNILYMAGQEILSSLKEDNQNMEPPNEHLKNVNNDLMNINSSDLNRTVNINNIYSNAEEIKSSLDETNLTIKDFESMNSQIKDIDLVDSKSFNVNPRKDVPKFVNTDVKPGEIDLEIVSVDTSNDFDFGTDSSKQELVNYDHKKDFESLTRKDVELLEDGESDEIISVKKIINGISSLSNNQKHILHRIERVDDSDNIDQTKSTDTEVGVNALNEEMANVLNDETTHLINNFEETYSVSTSTNNENLIDLNEDSWEASTVMNEDATDVIEDSLKSTLNEDLEVVSTEFNEVYVPVKSKIANGSLITEISHSFVSEPYVQSLKNINERKDFQQTFVISTTDITAENINNTDKRNVFQKFLEATSTSNPKEYNPIINKSNHARNGENNQEKQPKSNESEIIEEIKIKSTNISIDPTKSTFLDKLQNFSNTVKLKSDQVENLQNKSLSTRFFQSLETTQNSIKYSLNEDQTHLRKSNKSNTQLGNILNENKLNKFEEISIILRDTMQGENLTKILDIIHSLIEEETRLLNLISKLQTAEKRPPLIQLIATKPTMIKRSRTPSKPVTPSHNDTPTSDSWRTTSAPEGLERVANLLRDQTGEYTTNGSDYKVQEYNSSANPSLTTPSSIEVQSHSTSHPARAEGGEINFNFPSTTSKTPNEFDCRNCSEKAGNGATASFANETSAPTITTAKAATTPHPSDNILFTVSTLNISALPDGLQDYLTTDTAQEMESMLVPTFSESVNSTVKFTNWPIKKEAVVEGDIVLGGLMMVHEREDSITCGPVMPQGGIQALEAMLYTLDRLNEEENMLLPNITLGAHILDDCDKDTYGLEMAVDFIKGMFVYFPDSIRRK